MRLDRFITLNLVRPLRSAFRPAQSLNSHSSTLNRRLPILMYHSISEGPEAGKSPYYRTCTSPSRFSEHMTLLKSEGYQGVDLTTGLAWLNSEPSTLNYKPVSITFDDGFRDFYTVAAPILKEHGFDATMFLPTAFIGDDPHLFRPRGSSQRSANRECLTWSEVRELHAAGIEFGSHTVNHPKLVDLGWDQIEFELRTSKLELEARLRATAPAFAYPYAFPQADKNFAEVFRQMLHRVGYASCVTTEVGRARSGDDPFRLSRLPVNSDDDDDLLRGKLAGHYDWLAFPQATVKKIKHAVRPARKPTNAPIQRVTSAPAASTPSSSLGSKQT